MKRQEIFFRRMDGTPWPWTDDPILQEFRFTNVYRASDRVSQWLIRHVIYLQNAPRTAEDIFFRILLFKLFNRIETWKSLLKHFDLPSAKEFSVAAYDRVLALARQNGDRIYSAAYIMPMGLKDGEANSKHQSHLALLRQMLKDDVATRITKARAMMEVFNILRGYPGIGDFLAYQFAIDINYSELTSFTESAFVVPGPGAKDGLRKCFSDPGGLSEAELIKFVMERQDDEFRRLELPFKSLWGRPLQLIDCQNLFCEVDKYARVAHPEVQGHTGRIRIKQRYRLDSTPIDYWFPPKWNINERIMSEENRSVVDI